MKKRCRDIKKWIEDIIFYTIGALLYAVAVNLFTAPNDIAAGGATGIATVINYLTDIPIGTLILLINLPLFILSIIFIGGSFTVRTVIATTLMSLAVDALSFIKGYAGDKFLCSAFGGILTGIGMAMVFLRGGTTGGTDILGRLLRMKWRHISVGTMILIIDIIVIALAGVVYRSVENVLYAVIVIYVSTKVIDGAVYGLDTGKSFFIVSDKSREIALRITKEMGRGVTIFIGRGFYSGDEKEIINCCVRRNEAAILRDIVKSTDALAFVTVSNIGEILGEGFKSINQEEI